MAFRKRRRLSDVQRSRRRAGGGISAELSDRGWLHACGSQSITRDIHRQRAHAALHPPRDLWFRAPDRLRECRESFTLAPRPARARTGDARGAGRESWSHFPAIAHGESAPRGARWPCWTRRSRRGASTSLTSYAAKFLPRANEIRMSGPVLLFTAAISLAYRTALWIVAASAGSRRAFRHAERWGARAGFAWRTLARTARRWTSGGLGPACSSARRLRREVFDATTKRRSRRGHQPRADGASEFEFLQLRHCRRTSRFLGSERARDRKDAGRRVGRGLGLRADERLGQSPRPRL